MANDNNFVVKNGLVVGGDITTGVSTLSLINTTATTVNAFGAATTIALGAGTGNTTVNNNLVVTGNLTVNGTTTTVNSTTLSVDDKNIELGSVASPSDVTADGGGITLRGTTDKTLNWVDATDAWTSSEHFALASGKSLRLTGSSSGTAIIVAPAAAGTPTLTLPTTTGTFALLQNNLGAFATTTSSQLAGVISDETGSGALVFGTAPTISLPTINNIRIGYSTTVTAAGTTILTVNSNYQQFFTGTSTQIVSLPAPQTMTLGMSFLLVNNSTGNIEVRAANSATVANLLAGTSILVTSIDLTAGNGAAGWAVEVFGFSGTTGTGSVVLATSPTLTGTPAAPTATAGTNTTQIATTQFVQSAVAGNYLTKTANYTASAGDRILTNTSGGSFTITLPASPSTGDTVVVFDINDWEANNLTIARNGSTIEGVADDFILDLGQIKVDFVYSGTTWQVYAAVGAAGPVGDAGPAGLDTPISTTVALSIALG